jgi:hypothetical protein
MGFHLIRPSFFVLEKPKFRTLNRLRLRSVVLMPEHGPKMKKERIRASRSGLVASTTTKKVSWPRPLPRRSRGLDHYESGLVASTTM